MSVTATSANLSAEAAPESAIKTMTIMRALNEGLRRAMAESDRVVLMGEDIGKLGGVFRITEGLQAEFGERRVLDTPLAESGIVGTAIGMAMVGFRPVCEIQFDGFVFPAFDQITAQLAKMTNRHEGALSMPVVIRIPYGGHIGAIEHHQESPEAYFTHTPGLRVVSPSTPNDAYWMIQDAINSNDPVIFLEPKGRYWIKGEVNTAVMSGRADATTADSPITSYAVKQSNGKLEKLGEVYDGAPYGVVVQKQEAQFAEAVQQALTELKKDGQYDAILAKWGQADAAVTTFALNPQA